MLQVARLVVISIDIISSAEFSGYVDRLYYTGLLQQIFINKYYIIIIDIGYYTKLGEL